MGLTTTIYDGLKDNDVGRAMDEHFHRVDHMMFTNVVLTSNDGELLRDPVTGEVMTEEDGCD